MGTRDSSYLGHLAGSVGFAISRGYSLLVGRSSVTLASLNRQRAGWQAPLRLVCGEYSAGLTVKLFTQKIAESWVFPVK